MKNIDKYWESSTKNEDYKKSLRFVEGWEKD